MRTNRESPEFSGSYDDPFRSCIERIHSSSGTFVCVSDHRFTVVHQYLMEETIGRIRREAMLELFMQSLAWVSTFLAAFLIAAVIWEWWT